MDTSSILPVVALVIGAAIVVLLLRRFMRSRSHAEPEPEPAPRPATEEEHEYLDSSHILPGGPASVSDAALRKASEKGK
jgi:hypothetical protein